GHVTGVQTCALPIYVTWEVLRAVKRLSMASEATCFAIMSSWADWVAATERLNTANSATRPITRMAPEITTSNIMKPHSGLRAASFRADRFELFIFESTAMFLQFDSCITSTLEDDR